MRQVTGNLWTTEADFKFITTNGMVRRDGACVMGRGCALEAKSIYPGIEYRLGDLIQKHGNRCFRLYPDLGSFVVKHHWKQAADLDLIRKSCDEATQMADKWGWETILLPRPGCGNGSLDWHEDVEPVVAPLLDDRFKVISF